MQSVKYVTWHMTWNTDVSCVFYTYFARILRVKHKLILQLLLFWTHRPVSPICGEEGGVAADT